MLQAYDAHLFASRPFFGYFGLQSASAVPAFPTKENRMATPRNMTPAGRRKASISAAIKQRGHSPYNIWLVRPPFETRDVVLNSDIALEVFYFLEGEPDFVDIRYPISAPTGTGNDQKGRLSDEPFALVVRRDGSTASIAMRSQKAPFKPDDDASDSDVIEIGLEILDQAQQRIENWRRIIPCIRRVSMHPIATLERLIAIQVKRLGTTTVADLIRILADHHKALVIGAAASVLRKREIASDADTRPWSPSTLLMKVEP